MRKLYVLLLVSFCSFSIASFGQTYFTESFESQFAPNTASGPNAPTGWTQTRLGTLTSSPGTPGASGQRDWAQSVWSGTVWASNTLPNVSQAPYNTSASTLPSGAANGFGAAWFNDGYAAGSGTSGQNIRRLESPAINLSAASNPLVSFSYALYAGSCTMTVVASNDGGTTWSTLGSFSSLSSSNSWSAKTITVPSAYKVANAKIGFVANNTWGSYDLFLDNVIVREGTAPDAAPTNFSATAVGSGNMTVNWTDNSTNETSFRVYRSTDNVTFTQVGTDITSTSVATAGTTYSLQQTGLNVTTNYYYRIVSVAEVESAYLTGIQATTGPANIVSISSGNWSSPSTWSTGFVPSLNDNVTIANSYTVTIDNTAAACNNLTVGQGASGVLQFLTSGTTASTLTVGGDLTIVSGGTFYLTGSNTGTKTLNIGGSSNASTAAGNLVVNGIFNMDGGTNLQATVNFYGSTNAAITGAGSSCTFYSVVVNKGTTATSVLDIQRVITINAPTASGSRLTITNGTFKLSSASTLTPYYGSSTICAATGRLWLNNASAVVTVVGIGTTPSSGSPTVSGELRLDAGTFGYGSGSNTLTFTSGSGVLNMSGGVLNMYGAVSFPSATGTQMLLTGGAFNVYAQAGTNLSTSTAIFTIGTSTTVNWTGGVITIVDPHSATGGTAFTASSGGTKTITGGTLKFGNGTSVLSGGTLSNTSGFGLISGMPLWNVEIDNRSDASTSRIVRLLGSTLIANNIVVNTNGYLFLGSGTTAASLFMTKAGSPISNNGTIAGTQPSGTQYIGSLTFGNGGAADGPQTFNGSGFVNIGSIGISNTNGVTYTGSATNVQRVNAFTGVFNSGSLIIGHPALAPVVQIGGSTTSAGSFTSLPSYNTTAGYLTLVYSTSGNISNYQMGAANEIAPGDQILGSLSISSAAITVASNRNLTITGTLTLTGDLISNAYNLTIGTSSTVLGTVSGSGGVKITGYIKRWFATTGLPISATLANGGFPFKWNNDSRLANIYFNAATAASAAGTITITHTNGIGTADISPSFADNGAQMEKRTISKWAITTGDGLALSGTAGLELTGSNIGAYKSITDLRLIQANAATGTYIVTSGTSAAPIVKRSGLALTDLSNDHYIGSPAASLLKQAIQSGNWGDVTTWDNGIVPLATDDIAINSGVNVTLAGPAGASNYAATCKTILNLGSLISPNATNSLTIVGASTSGITNAGTVSLLNGTITIGAAGANNRSFTQTAGGILAVSNGTLNLFGNMSIATGSVFNQSGGNINVDGNDNGTAATSVASGTQIVSITAAASSDINLTGGTFTVVDPHYTTTNTMQVTYGTAGAIEAGVGHTFRFGDGISADPGSTSGFSYYSWNGTGIFKFGNVVVENANGGANRFLGINGTFFNFVAKNLTVNNGAEFRNSGTASTSLTAISGNLTVNTGGTFTSLGLVYFGDVVSASATTLLALPTAQAQIISGGGIFRNLTASPTAGFTNVQVYNTNAAGITLNGIDISLSGTLTFTKGNINTGTNKISLIAGALTSGAAQSTGWVNGNLQRNFATGSAIGRTFDVGTGNYAPLTITMATVSTAGNATVSTTGNDHPNIGTSGLNANKSVNRFWAVTNNSATFTTADVVCNWPSSEMDAGVTTSNLRVGKYDGSTWILPTVSNSTGTSIQASGITSFSEFAVAESASPLPATLLTFSGSRQGSANNLKWTVAQENDVQVYQLERSEDGSRWTTAGSVNSLGNTTQQRSYNFTDNNFAGLKQYYRLRQVDRNGSAKLSHTVIISGVKPTALTLIGLFPNPATSKLSVLVDAPAKDNVTLVVMDAVGRTIKLQKASVDAGSNTLSLDVSGLAQGSYLLKVTCEAACQTTTSKFVKE